MNTAPDSVDAGWSDQVGAYFTFGPGDTAGVWVLTILGFVLMIVCLIGYFMVEHRKLQRQVERLRVSGLKTETMPGGDAHHTPSATTTTEAPR